MTRTILRATGALACVLAVVAFASSAFAAPAPLEGPSLVLDPDAVSFGAETVGRPPSPSRPITVQNTGSTDVHIASVLLSGDSASTFFVTTDDCSGQSLGPGGECSIAVAFVPAGRGTKTATLTVTSDTAPEVGTVGLTGRGVSDALLRIRSRTLRVDRFGRFATSVRCTVLGQRRCYGRVQVLATDDELGVPAANQEPSARSPLRRIGLTGYTIPGGPMQVRSRLRPGALRVLRRQGPIQARLVFTLRRPLQHARVVRAEVVLRLKGPKKR